MLFWRGGGNQPRTGFPIPDVFAFVGSSFGPLANQFAVPDLQNAGSDQFIRFPGKARLKVPLCIPSILFPKYGHLFPDELFAKFPGKYGCLPLQTVEPGFFFVQGDVVGEEGRIRTASGAARQKGGFD